MTSFLVVLCLGEVSSFLQKGLNNAFEFIVTLDIGALKPLYFTSSVATLAHYKVLFEALIIC